MRDKSLLNIFLALNIALAGAFGVYLFLSQRRQPKVVTTHFPEPAKTQVAQPQPPNPDPPPAPAVPKEAPQTPPPRSATSTNQTALAQTANADPPAPAELPRPTPLPKKFTWQDVESDLYRTYIQNLRLSGCPEDKVRYIVLSDIDDLFAQRRLKDAVAQDVPWWRADANSGRIVVPQLLQDANRQLEEERRELIARLLGTEVAQAERTETTVGNVARLTGPVLGRLSPERLNAVQAICNDAYERRQNAVWESLNASRALNPVAEARLREQTRTELRQVLNPEELEEFLLRNSHNAFQLREELRGFDATPEEFRRIFCAVDAIDHAEQLAYGSAEAMSENQRERWQRQRDGAIREVLSPERYQAYLLTKDPLYRQAQIYAQQYGAPSAAVRPIYELSKSVETRRQQILKDTALTPDQKTAELQRATLEQQQNIQRIIREARAPR